MPPFLPPFHKKASNMPIIDGIRLIIIGKTIRLFFISVFNTDSVLSIFAIHEPIARHSLNLSRQSRISTVWNGMDNFDRSFLSFEKLNGEGLSMKIEDYSRYFLGNLFFHMYI